MVVLVCRLGIMFRAHRQGTWLPGYSLAIPSPLPQWCVTPPPPLQVEAGRPRRPHWRHDVGQRQRQPAGLCR